MSGVEVSGLFPVPFMRVSDLVDGTIVDALQRQFKSTDTTANAKTDLLSHSTVLNPDSSDSFSGLGDVIRPHLVEFGSLLFGEALDWQIKEMWINRLEPGGFQTVHSHANSFISGVIYLTRSHPSARTTFYRSMGGREFAFANEHQGVRMGPFNAPKWSVPETGPGDMVLFPSYLLHEVPKNEGEVRMTVAFNAIPKRLKSWDYELSFG